MTTIKELFEAQGKPVGNAQVRVGDVVAVMDEDQQGWSVYVATDEDVDGVAEWDAYRLLHRAAPVLPTSPGSILVGLGGSPRAVLVPGLGWYGINTEIFMSKKMLQKGLADGYYTILLDTGNN